jgi:poly-gamma-glutamate synthesis protein (capsule biosynthesis protein)
MKPFLIILNSIMALFLGLTFFIEPAAISIAPITIEKPVQSVKIIFAGDIMLDRGVESKVKTLGQGDFNFPFNLVADYFKKADLVFGNLEGVISDQGTNVGSIYSFRADPRAIEGLTSAGFNVLSLANNHAFDYTRQALTDCLSRLKEANISYVGAGLNEAEAFSPLIKEIANTKIAFLAYTNLGPASWKATKDNSGIAWLSPDDIDKVKQDIISAKEKADILVVSIHWGEEYEPLPSQTQVDLAREIINEGADVLIGHHPHVVQIQEKYQDGWIFYSLGNFIFDQGFSEETMTSQIIELSIENKKIKDVQTKTIKINDSFQPYLVNDNEIKDQS